EKAVPSGEQVALEPTLAHVLAQHFHYTAVWRDMVVIRENGPFQHPVGRLKERLKAVGTGLVRPEDAEVPGLGIGLHDIAKHLTQNASSLTENRARLRDAHG